MAKLGLMENFILNEFNNFASKNKLSEKSIDFFQTVLYPYLIAFLNGGPPLNQYFIPALDGVRKEVYVFDEFVLKLTRQKELESEDSRRSLSNIKANIYIENYVVPLKARISTSYNKDIHIDYFDCIIFQKKVTALSIEQIYNRPSNVHLIINREWLFSFIENNYTDEQAKNTLINFFTNIDLNNNNIGYDQNNQPVLFDW